MRVKEQRYGTLSSTLAIQGSEYNGINLDEFLYLIIYIYVYIR